MKLIVLAVVSIAVFRANCGVPPDGRGYSNGGPNISDSNLPDGSKGEAITFEPNPFFNGPFDHVSSTDVDMGVSTIEYEPELLQGGFQNHNSSDIGQLKEISLIDGTYQNDLKLRAGSKCKSDIVCSLLGGSCVSSSDYCAGREVPSVCSGAKCKCCITVNLEVKIHDLEKEVHSMEVNLTVANSNIKHDLEFIIGNITKADSNLDQKINSIMSTNSDLKKELQSLKEILIKSNANQDTKLDSIKDHQGCPDDLVPFIQTNQCFRLLRDSKRTWDASKEACKALGLQLAVLDEPITLRSFFLRKYGLDDATWIGARYHDASNMKWERTGVIIHKDSPLWWNDKPTFSSNSRLCLLTHPHWIRDKPNQPYHNCGDSDTNYPLCELVRA